MTGLPAECISQADSRAGTCSWGPLKSVCVCVALCVSLPSSFCSRSIRLRGFDSDSIPFVWMELVLILFHLFDVSDSDSIPLIWGDLTDSVPFVWGDLALIWHASWVTCTRFDQFYCNVNWSYLSWISTLLLISFPASKLWQVTLLSGLLR